MFAKITLVILIVLFLLYLWNSYFEGIVDDNDIIEFFLHHKNDNPSFVTDSIFFPVAKILTLEDIQNGEISSLNDISSLTNLDISLKHTPIYHKGNGDIFLNANNIRPNSPSFEFSSEGAIKINNVLYLDSIIDKYEVYCTRNDSNIIDLIKNGKSLFKTRLAGFVKIENESSNKISGDIKDVHDKVILVKLKANVPEDTSTDEDTNSITYDINYLEEDNKLSSDNNYALYIYEGLDIDGESEEGKEMNTYQDFYSLKCSDIIYYFSKRRDGRSIQSGGHDFNNYPKYKYHKIIDHIYYTLLRGDRKNIDVPDNINNKYLSYILGDNMSKSAFDGSATDTSAAAGAVGTAAVAAADAPEAATVDTSAAGTTAVGTTAAEAAAVGTAAAADTSAAVGTTAAADADAADAAAAVVARTTETVSGASSVNSISIKMQTYYNIIKKNLILFHIQISNIYSGDYLLEYITLDLNIKGADDYIFQEWRRLDPDRLSDNFKSLYNLKFNEQESGGWSDNILFDKRGITKIEYENISHHDDGTEYRETLMFLRIPDYTHLCGIASNNVDILRNITLKKNKDSWIINANTCVDNNELKVIKSLTSSETLLKNSKYTDETGNPTSMLRQIVDPELKVITF